MIFVLVLLGIAWSCKKTGDPASNTEVIPPIEQNIVSKNITTGSFSEVSNTTIGSSGATVKIAKPGTPVDGIEIAIPANSFSSNPSLKVSYAEIKSHQLGANFNPISPIISISCDGGYSNGLMSLTIPVKVPTGHIPLGFYLDETTGKLEGIPVNSYTATSITLLTRHFLPANKLKSGDINLKSTFATGANIVISSIAESALNLPPMITSGFKPGVDDWEFINYGSYIAPEGHCAGQTISAMWYYFEKKATEGGLYNKFSDNAKLWQDNARGYKLCSVIQQDTDWDGKVATFFGKYIDKNQELDKMKLLTIAGAMLVTGEPQAMGIYMLTGKLNPDGSPEYAGHAIICYQVSVSGGKLYISDPNTPGVQQSIDFVNNKFKPYLAKLNGNDPASPYPFVTYYAKTAVIEWDKIGKRYDELVNNTIGTIAPNIFPSYTIWVKDKTKDFELKDGVTVSKDTLSSYVECPTAVERMNINGKKIISSEVYGTDGLIKSKQNVPGVTDWSLSTGQYVKLTPGLNKLGYSIIGWNSTVLFDNSTERIPLFIDFKWINIYYTKLEISPNPIVGEPDKEITITAKSYGSAPKNAKYVWNFGDGTADVTVANDSIVKYKYPKAGSYNVILNLYDNATNRLVGTSTAKANINQAIVKLDISPNPIVVTLGKEIIITARSYGSGPKNAKYVWNFGDGSADVTKTNDSIVKYKYSKVGNYDVVLNLFDNTTNKLVGTSTTKANINLLVTKFSLSFYLEFYFDQTFPNMTKLSNQKGYRSLDLREIPCVQNGNIITASWDGNYSSYYHKGTATITLNSNNTVSFTVSDIYTNPGAYLDTWIATSKDIPFINDSGSNILSYGVSESFNVMQNAYNKLDYTDPKSRSISESTGIFYDPKSGLYTGLVLKLYY